MNKNSTRRTLRLILCLSLVCALTVVCIPSPALAAQNDADSYLYYGDTQNFNDVFVPSQTGLYQVSFYCEMPGYLYIDGMDAFNHFTYYYDGVVFYEAGEPVNLYWQCRYGDYPFYLSITKVEDGIRFEGTEQNGADGFTVPSSGFYQVSFNCDMPGYLLFDGMEEGGMFIASCEYDAVVYYEAGEDVSFNWQCRYGDYPYSLEFTYLNP